MDGKGGKNGQRASSPTAPHASIVVRHPIKKSWWKTTTHVPKFLCGGRCKGHPQLVSRCPTPTICCKSRASQANRQCPERCCPPSPNLSCPASPKVIFLRLILQVPQHSNCMSLLRSWLKFCLLFLHLCNFNSSPPVAVVLMWPCHSSCCHWPHQRSCLCIELLLPFFFCGQKAK